MSKSKRKKQRRQKGTKHTGTRSAPRGIPPPLYDGLGKAYRLDRQREWDQARDLLQDLDRRYPNRAEVLAGLLNVYYELGDVTSYQFACQRLVSLRPDDPDLRLMLAGSCMENVRPALALRNFRCFLERWPDDVRAPDVRKTFAGLEAEMEEVLQDLGLTGEAGLQLAALHEEVLCCLQQGEYGQVCQLAEQLLKRHPEFTPAINNLGEAHFREGRIADAVAAARRVLQQNPDNFHALANLARYLCASGRADEARTWTERLQSVESTDSDLWIKKAETFSFLGDDQAVLEAFQGSQQNPTRETNPHEALLCHLAAVAAMRLGRENDARRLWKRAVKLQPGLDVARANLEDSNKPVGQRHAPWPCDLDHWLPEALVCKLPLRLKRARHRRSEKALTRETRRYLQDHPQVAATLPMLLDRGDPDGREFAFQVAVLAETPELLEALRDFALGQRGPDRLRQKAAQNLRKAGILPAEPVRMWIKGQWQEVLVFGFEIYEEPNRVHRPQVEDLAREAMTALRNGDAQEAERLLKQALEIEPDALDLLNNLATAYRFQGRHDDWKHLVHQIHQRDPDYFFGRLNMALERLEEGDLEEAREMLTSLLSRQRLHVTEFTSLAQIQIELCRAEGHKDAARSWLQMWEDADPDNPDLRSCRRRLGLPGLGEAISKLAGR